MINSKAAVRIICFLQRHTYGSPQLVAGIRVSRLHILTENRKERPARRKNKGRSSAERPSAERLKSG
jgi:hypothetical protein